MGLEILTLGSSKTYTKESLLGGGAVVGKNVTISSITPIEGGNKVTFSYTLDNGTIKTSTMDVMDGKDGIDGLPGKNGKDGQPGKDGSDGVGISKIEKIGTVDLVDTYRITFTDNSTFDYEVKNGADGQGGSGGSSTLSADITSNVEVGGVPSGTNFVEGTNLEDIIKKILVKYLPPTATFTITPSNTLKLFGDTITSEIMKVVVTKKSNDITEIAFKADSTVLNSITSGVNNGGTFSYTYTPSTPIDNTVTLSVDVKDGEQTVTKSIKITFCYPTYYGTVADSVASMSASDIQGLEKRVAVNNKAMTWSGISMDYGKLCYAYPKSFGALTSIKDANNVDYINSYTRTEVTLTENGNSVVYYCYLLTDAAGVSNFKQIYA